MNNANTDTSTNKGQPQVDKDQNPSSPVRMEPSIDKDTVDASKQGAKVAPAKDEAADTSRR